MRFPFVVSGVSIGLSIGLAIAVGACGARNSGAPAWPKAAERETDGGESIDPREETVVAEVKDETPAVTDATKPASAVDGADKPATATPTDATPATTTVTAPEDTITVEEIVIEIDDE